MAESLSAQIGSSLVWLFQDSLGLATVADASRLEYDAQLTNGAGAGQANALWHSLRTLAAGATEDLTLSSLPQTIFGSSVAIHFAAVKGLLIVNAATAAGADLIVGAAAAAAWGAPFGATTHQVRVPSDSCLMLVNKAGGWPVAAGSADKLRITNVGGAALDYKIVVVGVHT